MPVVWICGPPGVGKSGAGWQLYGRWAGQGRTVGYLDIDQLAMRMPPADDPDAAARTKAANLAAMLPNYRAYGAERMVIIGIATPAEAARFEAAIGSIDWVRLTATRADLERRLTGRDGPDAAFPDEHAAQLEASTFARLVVDTGGLTPARIADHIDQTLALGDPIAADPGPPRRSRSEHRCRVIVLSGPRAVGVSTVGWKLFERSGADEPTAFVDLAQIGFLNAGADLAAQHDGLRAANLAAMVDTYAAQGCLRVIAVGALRHPPPGSTVFRLSASAERLRQRIAARRAWTGGPHLAGDDLRGRSAADGEQVLRQALDEAEALRRSGGTELVIDTSDLTADEVAEQLRRALRV